MPNGVIGNTTDSGSVKSRFEPWLGNRENWDIERCLNFFCNFLSNLFIFILTLQITIFGEKYIALNSVRVEKNPKRFL